MERRRIRPWISGRKARVLVLYSLSAACRFGPPQSKRQAAFFYAAESRMEWSSSLVTTTTANVIHILVAAMTRAAHRSVGARSSAHMKVWGSWMSIAATESGSMYGSRSSGARLPTVASRGYNTHLAHLDKGKLVPKWYRYYGSLVRFAARAFRPAWMSIWRSSSENL